MGIAAQNAFYRVFTAYRHGIVRKDRPVEGGLDSSVSRRLDFDQLASCACLGLSSPQERLASQETGRAARRGFLAAHAGELARAREHFAEAWERWRELEEGFCRTRMVGIIEGYEAYLEYRLSNRSEARRRLERALDSALLLEDRYGLTLFELQRMQLGHNLARIDWRFGFLDEAFVLAGALVGFLQGRRWDLPFHCDWRPERMRCCPVYLRKAMVVQIAGEAIDHLVAHPEHAHWETFLREAEIGDEEPGSRLFVDPRLGHWLRLAELSSKATAGGTSRAWRRSCRWVLAGWGPPTIPSSWTSQTSALRTNP